MKQAINLQNCKSPCGFWRNLDYILYSYNLCSLILSKTNVPWVTADLSVIFLLITELVVKQELILIGRCLGTIGYAILLVGIVNYAIAVFVPIHARITDIINFVR